MRGKAMRGKTRQGKARQGKARQAAPAGQARMQIGQPLPHPHLVPLRLPMPQEDNPLPLGGGVHANLSGVNLTNTTKHRHTDR